MLAGEKRGSIPVLGKNKAFLPFGDQPLVGLVVAALDRAETIGSITVVGPCDRLTAELGRLKTVKPIRLLEQGRNIFDNIIQGALSTFAEYRPGMGLADFRSLPAADKDKAAVMLTSDMPLIDPREVDHFLSTAPLDRADIIYGWTSHETLAPYEPAEGKPGIKFIYGCTSRHLMRHSNIAIYRPLRIAPVMEEFVQIIYSLRYQRYLTNVVKALIQLLRQASHPKYSYLFLLLEGASFCHNHGFLRLRDLIRQRIELPWAEAIISDLFQTRFATHQTIGPGLTLDVDDEDSYRVFLARIEEWKEIQKKQIETALQGEKPGQ